MIEEKQFKEIKSRVEQYLTEGTIKVKQPKENVPFFLTNAEDSLNSARCLYDMSTNSKFQEQTGYVGLNGYLWVVNSSYYSMFYNARALLENEGVKIRADLSIHLCTFDALIYFFYLTGKLQKNFFQYYIQAKEDAAELLGQQKAHELISDYFYEKEKRATFTYQTGLFAMQNKAKTSLDRATKFNAEIRRIIKSK